MLSFAKHETALQLCHLFDAKEEQQPYLWHLFKQTMDAYNL